MAGPAILLRSEGAVVEVNDPNSSDGFIEIPGVSAYTEQGGEATSREVSSFQGIRAVTGRPGIGTVQFTYASYLPHHPANRTILSAKADSRNLQFRVTTPEEAIAAAFGSGTMIGVAANTGVVSQVASTAAGASSFNFESDDLGPGLVLALFSTSGTMVDNGSGYAEGYEGPITYDGTASPAFAVGQRVAFANTPPSYTVIAFNATTITLAEPLSEAVSDDASIVRAQTSGGLGDANLYVVRNITDGGEMTVRPAPASAVSGITFAQLLIPSLRREFTATIQSAGGWDLGDQSQLGSTMTLQPTAALADPIALY